MEINAQTVSDYLSDRLGGKVIVDKVKQSFPGASRETWLVNATVDGRAEGFALRVDPPEGPSVPFSLKREYDVYRCLHGSEVPVAEPLWFDQDIEFASGRPHMVRRLAEGVTNIPGLSEQTPQGAELRKKIAFEVMEKLAIIHKLDWRAAGLGDILEVPANPCDALRADFNLWRHEWAERQPVPEPIIEEALCWLSEHIPSDSPRISLVKGNNGVGEEIWQDNKIVAMSDWELASLGDGVLDICFSQGTMQLADFDEILNHYEQAVGETISPERLAFGGFLIWLKQIVCLDSFMLRHYYDGKSDRLFKLAFTQAYTFNTHDRLSQCIGKDIVDAWRQVVASEYSIYTTFGGKQ